MSEAQTTETLKDTALFDRHVALGARMVPFAGYNMPVQYEGVLAEHKWTRSSAGLFDVSHMGQAKLTGEGAIATLEALTPTDFAILGQGKQKYSLLLNAEGGILDDWMVSRPEAEGFLLIVNAACKDQDFEIIANAIVDDEGGPDVEFEVLTDRALLALQGPKAHEVMKELCPEACDLYFMECGTFDLLGETAFISRSGYTGEDGFEISLPAEDAMAFARRLLAETEVEPIGLGARDTLRLEAGLCLYGHELDETIDPIEAGLVWSIPKRRRAEGGFPGAARIQAALTDGPTRRRVGLRVLGRAPAREGAEIIDVSGAPIGRITSGGFGPTIGAPIAMGYVATAHAEVGTPVGLVVRGKPLPATVAALPFQPHAYYRG